MNDGILFSTEAAEKVVTQVKWASNLDKNTAPPDSSTYGQTMLACFELNSTFTKADGEKEYRASATMILWGGETNMIGQYKTQATIAASRQCLYYPIGEKTDGGNPLWTNGFIPASEITAGQKVWAVFRGRWEVITSPLKLYITMSSGIWDADHTTGIITPDACSMYAWLGGHKVSTGGGTITVKSMWESSGFNYETNAISVGYKFALLVGRDYEVKQIVNIDNDGNATVLVDPCQQTFPAITTADLSYDSYGEKSYKILLQYSTGGSIQKVNAWTYPSINADTSITVIPANTPCMVTEVAPGNFYSLISPSNPVGYQPQAGGSPVPLKTLQFGAKFGMASSDSTGDVDTNSYTAGGFTGNIDDAVTANRYVSDGIVQ